MYIIKKSVNLTPPKKKKKLKEEKMNLSKKGELLALDRQIHWTKTKQW